MSFNIIFTFILGVFLFACSPGAASKSISGMVIDEDGNPLPGAVVCVKADSLRTVSDAQSRFSLIGLIPGSPVFITAWLNGYYINGVDDVMPGATDVMIVLVKFADSDNSAYEFVSAFSSAGLDGNCQNCHSDELGSSLPFDEWREDVHALSAQNSRFLSMYLGQDRDGNQSPLRRYGYNRDYGRIPLPPDLSRPYYGPGYKLDFPNTEGNCAACHAPAAALNAPYATNPTQITGVGAEGVACDFCHKVWDVHLTTDGLPQPNMPGVLSFEFRRPEEGHQFFAGPFYDVAPGEDTFSPLQQQSRFCAPCHFGIFWDTVIYNSFGEWLNSPYSDPDTGKTCQDCHMPHRGASYVALPSQGAVERDPQTIFSHLMPGAADENLLRNAVNMDVTASRDADRIIVEVKVTNDQTGHDVPTDSPLRQVLLIVQAVDETGTLLPLMDGPVLPDWAGIGDPSAGYYAGLPGRGYAKILMEMWTQVSPTAAYWTPTQIVSDTRIPAFSNDSSHYEFLDSLGSEISIFVKLLYRRAFIELSDQKSWGMPDILMENQNISLPAVP